MPDTAPSLTRPFSLKSDDGQPRMVVSICPDWRPDFHRAASVIFYPAGMSDAAANVFLADMDAATDFYRQLADDHGARFEVITCTRSKRWDELFLDIGLPGGIGDQAGQG